MADNKLLQQMLESLVNDDQAKAEEKDEDEEVEEASDDEEAEEDKVEENFGQFEAGDEMDLDSEDPTDDLAGELGGDEEGEGEAEEGEEQLFQDLEAIVDELQAKFDELKGVEGEEHGDEFGDEDEEGEEGGNPFAKEEGINDLATVREYVEKVPAGHGAEKKGAGEGALVGTGNKGQGSATNAQSLKFNKNDMGGTTANILRGDTEQGVEANQGQLKGSSLIKQKPTEDNAGNINVPGGKAGSAFSKKEPGHGAEKAGAKESADNKQSLFRGRR
jgi:hypothetical protein